MQLIEMYNMIHKIYTKLNTKAIINVGYVPHNTNIFDTKNYLYSLNLKCKTLKKLFLFKNVHLFIMY